MKRMIKFERKVPLTKHDPTETLRDTDLVFETFLDRLKAGDSDGACEILAARLSLMNKSLLARRYHIPRRTTYNLLQKRSTPTLDFVAKACYAIEREASREKRAPSLPQHLAEPEA